MIVLKLELQAGYSYSILDSDFGPEDFSFLRVAGAASYSFSKEFSAGVDLGCAVGINEGNDGVFYFAPRIQYGVSEKLDVVLSYRGISLDALTWNTVNLGVEFGL